MMKRFALAVDLVRTGLNFGVPEKVGEFIDSLGDYWLREKDSSSRKF